MSDPGRSLEERVAALEELAAHPLLSVTAPEFSEEQAREFEERVKALGLAQHEITILPPGPRKLTEDEVRQILRECVTVVKPGETLVIRGDRNWSPNQLREVQDMVDGAAEWRDLGFKVLVVPGEELGVAEPPPGPFSPILPVRLEEPPGGWRSEPRRCQYPFSSLPVEPGRVTCEGCGAVHQVEYGRPSRCDPGCGAELPLIRKIYRVEATRDGEFWSVHVPAVDRTTQALDAGDVEPMARDLIVLMDEIPADAFAVAVSWRPKP